MLIDVTQVLRNIKTKEPIPMEAGKPEIASLQEIMFNALVNPHEGDDKLSAKDKYKRGKLAEKIIDAKGPIDLTVEEIAEAKKFIGLSYGINILVPAFNLIEGAKPVELVK